MFYLFLVPRSKFSELVFDIISPVSLLFIFLRILILLHLPLQLNVLIQLTSDLHFAKSNSSFSYYLSITAAFDTLLFSNHPKLEILDSAFVWVLLPYGHLVILTTYMKQPSPLHITHTHTHTHTHTEAHESTMHAYTDSLKKILYSLSYLFFSLWHMSPFDRLCIYLFIYHSPPLECNFHKDMTLFYSSLHPKCLQMCLTFTRYSASFIGINEWNI